MQEVCYFVPIVSPSGSSPVTTTVRLPRRSCPGDSNNSIHCLTSPCVRSSGPAADADSPATRGNNLWLTELPLIRGMLRFVLLIEDLPTWRRLTDDRRSRLGSHFHDNVSSSFRGAYGLIESEGNSSCWTLSIFLAHNENPLNRMHAIMVVTLTLFWLLLIPFHCFISFPFRSPDLTTQHRDRNFGREFDGSHAEGQRYF